MEQMDGAARWENPPVNRSLQHRVPRALIVMYRAVWTLNEKDPTLGKVSKMMQHGFKG